MPSARRRSNPRIVYALAGDRPPFSPFDGLFSSNDFGKSWKRRSSVLTGFGFAKCEVDPDDARTVYVFGFNPDFLIEVWKSTDGGRTFQNVVLPFPPSDSSFVKTAHRTLCGVDATEGVYASRDGGVSFQ